MRAATIRIGDPIAPQRQQHFGQADSGTIAREQNRGRSIIKNSGHREWAQRIDEAWQGHVETLHQCVRELLVMNQQQGWR
jgi:hypothetical protein